MKLFFFLISFFTGTLLFGQQQPIDDIFSDRYTPKSLADFQLSSTGDFYYTLNADSTLVLKYACKDNSIADTLFSNRNLPEGVTEIASFFVFSDESKILIASGLSLDNGIPVADYFVLDRRRNKTIPVSEYGRQQLPSFSPNGRMVAFVREHNIFIKRLDFETEIQVTKDGKRDAISNGIPNNNLIAGFGYKNTLQWSADNRYIAFVKYNFSNIAEIGYECYTDDIKTGYSLHKKINYATAGANMPQSAVWIYDMQSKGLKEMNLPKTDDAYIPSLKFTAINDTLAISKLNRKQNKLEIFMGNPRSGVTRLVHQEESPSFISPENTEVFFVNGDRNFILTSDRNGYRHIYLYGMNGVLSKQLTAGSFDVSYLGFNENKKLCYYSAGKKSPVNKGIYCVDLKGKETALIPENESVYAIVGSGNNYFMLSCESNTKAPVLSLRNGKGDEVAVLETNSHITDYLNTLPKKESFSFTSSDNRTLYGWIVKPASFSETNTYPVILLQPCKAGQQQASANGKPGIEHALAGAGYIVAAVDGNGSSGYGRDMEKSVHKKAGYAESKDQLIAATHLMTLPYVDNENIHILGMNYGGLIVLHALSLGETVFTSGIAISPITDWRYENNVISERVMSTPQENFAGYENYAPISLIQHLQGNLLLIHGSADEDVPLINTMKYADALVNNGKAFDMHIYTNQPNTFDENARKHLYEKIIRYLK